ncbi:hypothetical protein [Sphingobium estronivorans]|nr:hypothetical protein [Sphingobium estronivorans]
MTTLTPSEEMADMLADLIGGAIDAALAPLRDDIAALAQRITDLEEGATA